MRAMVNAQEIKSGMLSAESGVQEVLRALYFYGADYIMFKIGRREKLVHKEQLISLMELGNERTTIDEMSVMTLPEPVSAKTRVEDVPPDTALLMFFRKEGGPAGVLSMTSFGEYRERKIKEAEAVYPEWWGAPIPLLYMDNERVALNDAAGAKIPCEARELAAQADKMKRDGIITVKDKKREFTFSLHPLEENVYLIEDISGDFEMAEELVWWAAVGKAFVRRLEENGAMVRRMSPLEAPPASAAEVIPCSWENESLGSVVIGMPGDAGWNATQETDAGREEKEVETVSSNTNRVTEPDAPSKPEPQKTEVPAQTGEPETGPVPEKPSRGKRARETGTRPQRKRKHERSALWTPKDDLNLDLNAISEPVKVENESLSDQPEIPIPSAWYESFGPFGKPAAKRGKAAAQAAAEKVHDEGSAAPEQDLPRAADQDGGEEVKNEDPAGETAAPPKVLDKNAARRAYGGSQRRKVPGGSLEKA